MKQSYIASKSRTQNRPGWSISFRHPLRNDTKGKAGLKMRRGLGTNDEQVAEEMIAQMNEILADESWWSAAKRPEAAIRFHRTIVDAFFDEIQAGRFSPEHVREVEIPLPGAQEGYSRVQFVGTTGAGKTSLVRQLIGSDPDEDRFPSTAPAKTTIADLEVIQAEGEFQAVVTFFSEFQIQAYVEECVMAASVAVFDGGNDAKVADRLLNHSDQKFRLSYVLGVWPDAGPDDAEEFSFDDAPQTAVLVEPGAGGNCVERLQSFVDRIKSLAKAADTRLRAELGVEFDNFLKNDRTTVESWFEEFICESDSGEVEAFFDLTHDIMDEIRIRFDSIQVGALVRTRSDWPESWTFGCGERNEFIKQVRWFSSNYWPEFGRLLTPIVQGIRVKGPLFPTFGSVKPRLVLIDGQGLGHTPDSSTSVPTDITRRFASVDVILLVDNAQQPMLAASQSVLRIVAASGYHHKLAVAFTHFDLIKGDNLRSLEDKRAHVMGSVVQAIASLRDIIGAPVARAVEQSLPSRCLMLGGIDRRNEKLPAKPAEFVRNQMLDLIKLCEAAIEPITQPEASPIYDPTGIGFAIREAVTKFIGPWNARLGLASYSGVPREHYNRIKALNRRIAGDMGVEYDSLRPVADLVARLSEAISLFLDKPIAWTRTPVDDSEAEASISQVRRNIAGNIHEIALHRLVEEHLSEWRKAHELKGRGSAHERSVAMKRIYETAAPLPDTVMTEQALRFVVDIRKLIEAAIKEAGGRVQLEALTLASPNS